MPAPTGSGLSVIVTERSALAVTVVVAVALLLPAFESVVDDDTVAVFESTVPFCTARPTLTTSVKTPLPALNDVAVQLIEPLAPTAGVVHDHPPGLDNDTKVVPTGNVSASVTLAATLGPALATVIV